MRIITKGDPKFNRPITIECKSCNSTLEIEPADCKFHSGYNQRETSYWDVKCPVCKRGIAFNPSTYGQEWEVTKAQANSFGTEQFDR
jgi:phage FluMu protein Com